MIHRQCIEKRTQPEIDVNGMKIYHACSELSDLKCVDVTFFKPIRDYDYEGSPLISAPLKRLKSGFAFLGS